MLATAVLAWRISAVRPRGADLVVIAAATARDGGAGPSTQRAAFARRRRGGRAWRSAAAVVGGAYLAFDVGGVRSLRRRGPARAFANGGRAFRVDGDAAAAVREQGSSDGRNGVNGSARRRTRAARRSAAVAIGVPRRAAAPARLRQRRGLGLGQLQADRARLRRGAAPGRPSRRPAARCGCWRSAAAAGRNSRPTRPKSSASR